jgi:hypothetical protein
VDGQPVAEQELPDAISQQQLRNRQYEVESKALGRLIRLKVVQAAAKKRGSRTDRQHGRTGDQ